MPDAPALRKWIMRSGVAHIPQLKIIQRASHRPPAGCKRARQSSDGGDINQCRCETVTLRQVPTTSGTVMPPRPPAKLNTPPVNQSGASVPEKRPATRLSKQTVAEECQRHQAHNHHRIVGVFAPIMQVEISKPQIIGVLRASPVKSPYVPADPRPSQRAGPNKRREEWHRGHKTCFQRRDPFSWVK